MTCDLNERTCNDNTGRERVMGTHGLRFHSLNDNGERMCDFCEFNSLLVGALSFSIKISTRSLGFLQMVIPKHNWITLSSIENGRAPYKMSESTQEQIADQTITLLLVKSS